MGFDFIGKKAEARNLVFFRVKWLQLVVKGTSCVRQVRLGSFERAIASSFVFRNGWCSCVRHCASFFSFVDFPVADRSVVAA